MSDRPDEWDLPWYSDPVGEPRGTDLIPTYKCTKCGTMCTGADGGRILLNTVDNCQFKTRIGTSECGLKQMANFVRRMSALVDKKEMPWVLRSKEDNVIPLPPKPVDTQVQEIEVYKPDPILILIDKKGHVTTIDSGE
jgi:hypothetical protein